MIFKFIKRNRNGRKNQRVGLLVAKKVNGVPQILWSLCRKDDKFDRAEAFNFASVRPVPCGIGSETKKFAERATRYFKEQVNVVYLEPPVVEETQESV